MGYNVAVFLGKTLNAVSHLGVKQYTRVDPDLRKTCKNSFCVGVVGQTQQSRVCNIWFKRRMKINYSVKKVCINSASNIVVLVKIVTF